jgi:hypothetical protein
MFVRPIRTARPPWGKTHLVICQVILIVVRNATMALFSMTSVTYARPDRHQLRRHQLRRRHAKSPIAHNSRVVLRPFVKNVILDMPPRRSGAIAKRARLAPLAAVNASAAPIAVFATLGIPYQDLVIFFLSLPTADDAAQQRSHASIARAESPPSQFQTNSELDRAIQDNCMMLGVAVCAPAGRRFQTGGVTQERQTTFAIMTMTGNLCTKATGDAICTMTGKKVVVHSRPENTDGDGEREHRVKHRRRHRLRLRQHKLQMRRRRQMRPQRLRRSLQRRIRRTLWAVSRGVNETAELGPRSAGSMRASPAPTVLRRKLEGGTPG